MFCLNRNALSDSFFHLSPKDPEKGFTCDLTSVAGCAVTHDGGSASAPATAPSSADRPADLDNPKFVRLLLASHLARHLRLKIEEDFGFTSACGVSVNKLLSKLAGSQNKPRNQTTLLALVDDDAVRFMDGHPIRKIPGIGARTTQVLEGHILGSEPAPHSMECTLTGKDVRTHPGMSAAYLEKLLGGPGTERGIGEKVWGLLHGVDATEVKAADDVPTQISIEDTYKGLNTMELITDELRKLAYSLVRRMRVDLLVNDPSKNGSDRQRWIAHPKTLRISIREWPVTDSAVHSFSRISRSQPLPGFVFNLKDPVEQIADRLVSDALLPLLRRLQPANGHNWNMQLMNICVANMAVSGSEDRPGGVGRDISDMFKKQDDVLRQWKIDTAITDEGWVSDDIDETVLDDNSSEVSWGDDQSLFVCQQCGHAIPAFATSAHARYHEFGE
jgi:DNA polymerase iota